MYQNRNQSAQDMNTTTSGADLYLLFDKFSGNPRANDAASADKIRRSLSTPTSANVSPFMSEKECSNKDENEPESPEGFNPKSRRLSLNKAERRAEHNAIERARRECLNSKFQQLAEALPNLQNHRRPSKGQIVEKALDWVKQNMSKEDRYQYQIMQLQNENKRLLSQINIIQDQSNNSLRTPPTSSKSSPPITAPFPASLRQQQFPANSTPSTIDIPTTTSFVESTNPHISPYYDHQVEGIPTVYPMGPFSVDWRHPQQALAANSSTEYMLPTATISTSSRKFVQSEEDNESDSSGEDAQQIQQLHMAYSDMAQCNLFDLNHPMGPSWNKGQHSTNYTYQVGYSPANNANPVYSHITYYS